MPLRREIREPEPSSKRPPAPPFRVLLSLGGSSPRDVTEAVLQGLAQTTGDLRIRCLTRQPELFSSFACPPAIGIEPLADSLREPLTWADLAILGAGSTRYEAAFLGTPALLVLLANNQHPGRLEFEALGCARFLRRPEALEGEPVTAMVTELLSSPERLVEMSRRGREVVDGKGADRIARELLAMDAPEEALP